MGKSSSAPPRSHRVSDLSHSGSPTCVHAKQAESSGDFFTLIRSCVTTEKVSAGPRRQLLCYFENIIIQL